MFLPLFVDSRDSSGNSVEALLVDPNNSAITQYYNSAGIDDPFTYRAREGFIGIEMWPGNDTGVYLQEHLVIPNPWGDAFTNGTTTTTTTDTTAKGEGDDVEPCGSGHFKECFDACYRGQTGRDFKDDWNLLQEYEAICGELKARGFWSGVVWALPFFTGLAGLIGMIAGASISGIWEWVNGKSTAELNQRKGALESKNPWLKDPQKREAAYEAMRYCRDRCIRYDGYGEAIE